MAETMALFSPVNEDQQSIEDQLAAAIADEFEEDDDISDFGFEPTINPDVAAALQIEGLNIPKPETPTQDSMTDLLAAAMADELDLGSPEEEAHLLAAMVETSISDSGSETETVRFFRSSEVEPRFEEAELEVVTDDRRRRWELNDTARDIGRHWNEVIGGGDGGVENPFEGGERVQRGKRSRSRSPRTRTDVGNDDLGETY